MAQLGARFHGMEEVIGSNPIRSTKTFHTLTVRLAPRHLVTGVLMESSMDAEHIYRAGRSFAAL